MHFQCAYKFRAMSWSINNVMSHLYYYLFYMLNSGELVPIPVTLLALYVRVVVDDDDGDQCL